MNRKILLFALFIIVLAFLADSSFAQIDGEDFRAKIEKIKIEKLVKKLNLDSGTEEVFTQKYKDFTRTIRELNKKRAKVVKKIEQNLDNGEGLDTMVNQMLEIEQEITTQRKNYAEDLRTYLTSKQIATLIIFEKNFAAELRKLIRDYRKENRKEKK